MSFKIKRFLVIMLFYTLQINAQTVSPVMPTTELMPTSEPAISTNLSSSTPTQIPTKLPTANKAPVMIPIAKETETAPINNITTPATTPKTAIIKTAEPTTSLKMPTPLEMPTEQIKSNIPSATPTELKKIDTPQPKPSTQVKRQPQQGTISDKELDFEVENQTGKTLYVSCFSYIKKRPFSRWRWDKSDIYKIEDKKSVTVNVDTIIDEQDRNNTFGYLAVFENMDEAEDSTFQLLDDNRKIDLDLIIQLKDKKVVLEIEKYGIAGEFYDYDFANKKKDLKPYPELDFYIENKTGKTILVTCFVYQKKAKGTWLAQKTKESWAEEDETRDDMSVWRFDKTSVIKIKPNESGLIDIDSIIEPRDRIYMRGYLAVFGENEKEEAEKSIYELLPARRKLDLGRLVDLKDKQISVYTERYGILGNFIDYVPQPTTKPNITNIIKGYFK